MANMLDAAKFKLRTGRSDIAETLCARLLETHPNDIEALGTLASAYLQREGPVPRAVDAFRRAVTVSPEDCALWCGLAEAELRSGGLGRADKALAEARRIDATSPVLERLEKISHVLQNEQSPLALGSLSLEGGDLLLLARAMIIANQASRARQVLTRVQLDQRVSRADWLPSWCRALAGTGDLEMAVTSAAELWETVLPDRPFRRRMIGSEIEALCRALEGPMRDDVSRRVLLSRVLLDRADGFLEGIEILNSVLADGDAGADALVAGGDAYVRQGAFDEAQRLMRQVRAQFPDHPATGRVLAGAIWADEASEALPPDGLTANELARLAEGLCVNGELTRAAEVMGRAVDGAPGREDLLVALADVLAISGRFEDARDAVDAALEIHPLEPKARMLRATLSLQAGDLETGWHEFESRLEYWRRDTPGRVFDRPRWRGEDGDGRVLMVWREEGIGDEMRFAACLADLSDRGFRKVIFECAPRLVGLFARSFPHIHVRAEAPDDNPQDYDVQIPLFSLPGLLRPGLTDFGDTGAYLHADERLAGALGDALSEFGPGPYIGISWRSLNGSWMKRPFHAQIKDLGPILAIKDASMINLQVGATAEEMDVAGRFGILNDVPGLDLRNDIDGTAALIAGLDMVVSARCWVPILAGALGVRTHCFTAPFNPYFLGRNPDPWMMSVRVHAALPDAGWNNVMAGIAADIDRDLGRSR